MSLLSSEEQIAADFHVSMVLGQLLDDVDQRSTLGERPVRTLKSSWGLDTGLSH